MKGIFHTRTFKLIIAAAVIFLSDYVISHTGDFASYFLGVALFFVFLLLVVGIYLWHLSFRRERAIMYGRSQSYCVILDLRYKKVMEWFFTLLLIFVGTAADAWLRFPH